MRMEPQPPCKAFRVLRLQHSWTQPFCSSRLMTCNSCFTRPGSGSLAFLFLLSFLRQVLTLLVIFNVLFRMVFLKCCSMYFLTGAFDALLFANCPSCSLLFWAVSTDRALRPRCSCLLRKLLLCRDTWTHLHSISLTRASSFHTNCPLSVSHWNCRWGLLDPPDVPEIMVIVF